MIGNKSQIAGIVTLLLAAGCASKSSEKFGNASSGAEAWAVADAMTAKVSSTEIAIQKAKSFSEDNIANAETISFKARVCRVENRSIRVTLNMDQGSLESTSRPLDVAIQGNGFFRVKVGNDVGDGYGYTRNGNFFRDQNGDLVIGLGEGFRLDPPINIPMNATHITISQNGLVQVETPGSVSKTVAGQIMLYLFQEPGELLAYQPTLFTQTDAAGSVVECKPSENAAGALIQNELERSNVDVVREMRRIEYLDRWRAAMLDRW